MAQNVFWPELELAVKDCERMEVWMRKLPELRGYFITETRAIMAEKPAAFVQSEEVLCRVRRIHGVKITNHKGWFARWLVQQIPELKIRPLRKSRFDAPMGKGRKPRG